MYFCLRIELRKAFTKKITAYQSIKEGYNKICLENINLKNEISSLQKKLKQIMALYDVTKEICKSLDADKVFVNFKEELSKYIVIGDCKFLKDASSLPEYNGYTAVPLMISDNPIGYLIAVGVKEEDKATFQVLSLQFILGIKRALLYQQVQELAVTDSLTQAFSRRYFLDRFNEEIGRAKNFGHIFSCLMIDIDHFKNYNDCYGHLVGDAILKELSRVIKENIRQIDLMGRYGGEEFSIILSETDKDLAKLAAERIRQAIEGKSIKVYDEELKVTVSIGVSTYPQDGKGIDRLIDKADSALYKAKQAGRNKVCLYGA